MVESDKTVTYGDAGKSASQKKPAAKKTAASKEKSIKYSDKSAGQPEMVIIFDSIKTLMKHYVKGPIKERGERGGIYIIL